jgi:uncharacterized protein (TIGR02271 family)
MLGTDRIADWQSAELVDPTGDKIGGIDEIYVDDDTGEPEFAVVRTGFLAITGARFVPLQEGAWDEEGRTIRVAWDKETIKNSPDFDAGGDLSESQEQEIYRYYGIQRSEARSQTGLPSTGTGTGFERQPVGRDTSGPTTDDAMTRSEEELHVGTERRAAGKARLVKYVETEMETRTVPVQKERVRVEREPITDANVDRATAGPDISEEEHEVTLMEEEAVVEKRAVPKERVRLDKESVTDEETVSEEVRKEQIRTEGDINR